MEPLHEYEQVHIVKLLYPNRPFDASDDVGRAPAVGDCGTIVHVFDFGTPSATFVVESVHSDGRTIWLADFAAEELERVI